MIVTTELTTINCAECFILFAAPSDFILERRKDHAGFKCPFGHANYYPQKSDAERAAENLALERTSAQKLRDENKRQRRSLIAVRGVATRRKNELNELKEGSKGGCK